MSGKSPLKWTIFTGRKVSKDSMEGVLWAYAAASTIIEKKSQSVIVDINSVLSKLQTFRNTPTRRSLGRLRGMYLDKLEQCRY